MFVATWLSYVGLLFCRKPFTSAKHAIGEQNHWKPETLGNIYAAYLIAYAIGQFLASRPGRGSDRASTCWSAWRCRSA